VVYARGPIVLHHLGLGIAERLAQRDEHRCRMFPLLSFALIIATPFWQADLLSAKVAVARIITAAATGNRTERILLSPRPAHA
jgi:hypothetical protein